MIKTLENKFGKLISSKVEHNIVIMTYCENYTTISYPCECTVTLTLEGGYTLVFSAFNIEFDYLDKLKDHFGEMIAHAELFYESKYAVSVNIDKYKFYLTSYSESKKFT